MLILRVFLMRLMTIRVMKIIKTWVSENGLNGVLTDRNNKIKLITGVAPFDDILFMDDDFDDSSSEEIPLRIVLLRLVPFVSSSKSSFQ